MLQGKFDKKEIDQKSVAVRKAGEGGCLWVRLALLACVANRVAAGGGFWSPEELLPPASPGSSLSEASSKQGLSEVPGWPPHSAHASSQGL